ncbi:MAG: hypothetical protein KJ626_10655 [Verrucomicrobia bacterium]|nr:hypothetical protein [Verrucomicrobiota bacterium]
MRGDGITRFAWIIAAAALLCAGGLTLRSWGIGREMKGRIARKAADLDTLRGLKAGSANERAAVATYEALSSKTVVPLRDVLSEAGVSDKAEIRERDARPVSSGWTLRRMDVIFDELPLKGLGAFLSVAEKQRPPWQLVECHITASEKAGRDARVTLLMETLEKKE